MAIIGYQHGITAMMNRLRDMDPGGTVLVKAGGKWPSIDTITVPLDQWRAYDKAERAFSILVYDHDAAVAEPPTEPPTKPPAPEPTYKRVAPRVAYKAGNSDARYCLFNQPGVYFATGEGAWRDDVATYDENGLCRGGRSDGSPSDCYTSALEIDGRAYCSLPTQGDPIKNTGSWIV